MVRYRFSHHHMKSRISFFVHDLADNPVVRAVALANALKPLYEIEILGLLITGKDVYAPYRNLYEYKTIRCDYGLPNIMAALKPLYSMASGDIIYACKPLITSFLPALFAAKFTRRRLLFLDVEDDHWGHPETSDILSDPFCGLRNVDGWLYTRILHPFTFLVDGITVVSTELQQRYGGMIIRHGPDELEFDPARPDLRDAGLCRQRFNLPSHRKLLLFAGIPRAHKGFPILLEALQRPECDNWDLVMACPPTHPDSIEMLRILGTRCRALGFVPYSDMPALLAAVDAVPLPQLPVPFARSQVPAKLLDAMSMAKPIIASRVGDLGEILGEGDRGWVVKPGCPAELALALTEIETNPDEAARRGAKAREWFLAEASGSTIRSRLHTLIQTKLLKGGAPGRPVP